MRFATVLLCAVAVYGIRRWSDIWERRIVTMTIEAARAIVEQLDGDDDEGGNGASAVSSGVCECGFCRGDFERDGDEPELGFRRG